MKYGSGVGMGRSAYVALLSHLENKPMPVKAVNAAGTGTATWKPRRLPQALAVMLDAGGMGTSLPETWRNEPERHNPKRITGVEMNSKYSVSQLEDMARTLRAGTALLSEVDDAADMLAAYAERIEADDFSSHTHDGKPVACTPNPPAQATQVEVMESGYRARSNHWVHRFMDDSLPCYCWSAEDHIIGEEVRAPTAEPVARGEAVALPSNAWIDGLASVLRECDEYPAAAQLEELKPIFAAIAAQHRAVHVGDDMIDHEDARAVAYQIAESALRYVGKRYSVDGKTLIGIVDAYMPSRIATPSPGESK